MAGFHSRRVCAVDPRDAFRPRVWVALCLGALPLVLFRDHLATLREVYGHNPWAPPSPVQVITGSDWLFGVRHFGFALAVGIATGIAYRIVSLRSPAQRLNTSISDNTAESWPGITEEGLLSLGLLAVPAIGVTVAMIMGGDLDPRYMLMAVVGGAIGFGLLLSRAAAPVRWFVLFAAWARMPCGFRTRARIAGRKVGATEGRRRAISRNHNPQAHEPRCSNRRVGRAAVSALDALYRPGCAARFVRTGRPQLSGRLRWHRGRGP